MNPTNKIHIAGHRSLVGSALMRRRTNPSPQTIEATPTPPPRAGEAGRGSPPICIRSPTEFGLTDQSAIDAFRAHGKHGPMSYCE